MMMVQYKFEFFRDGNNQDGSSWAGSAGMSVTIEFVDWSVPPNYVAAQAAAQRA